MAEPLWRVMQRADSTAASDYQSPEARMIRAIAEAIREEFEGSSLAEIGTVKMIRDFFSEEADRAERGEE